ncbi:MAG: beta-N-acetylglucosaminidase domain-containing protein [Fidelibacterota bacterium]
MKNTDFICGTLEGFYGRPWKTSDRYKLFKWMEDWGGMNTYMYAPKDDLYHRSKWRELYPDHLLKELKELMGACHRRHLTFIYAIAPGLDIKYGDENDWNCLMRKIDQIQSLGGVDFAILFDDIPNELSEEDQDRFSSFAEAHAHITNRLFNTLQQSNADSSLIFCPTVYCGRMADYDVAGNPYLNELGRLLHPEIGFFWTGPDVISSEISVESIRELRQVINRKPVIWDNLHANDYDIRQMFFGPYSGRPVELKNELSGILSNPNCQFWANVIPLKTLSMFHLSTGEWHPEQAYLDGLSEWKNFFGNDNLIEKEVQLLGDCFYLPGKMGEMGNKLLESMDSILKTEPEKWGVHLESFNEMETLLNSLCKKLMEATNRDLLYDFYLILWELKEEVAYVSSWIQWKISGKGEFKSTDFVPRRQGLLYEIQRRVYPEGN